MTQIHQLCLFLAVGEYIKLIDLEYSIDICTGYFSVAYSLTPTLRLIRLVEDEEWKYCRYFTGNIHSEADNSRDFNNFLFSCCDNEGNVIDLGIFFILC